MSKQFQTNVNRFIDYVKNNINTYELINEQNISIIIIILEV